MTTKKTSAFNFEKALNDLENMVKTMEEGSLSLEESLKYFERGMTAASQCQQALNSAEQKVQILVNTGKTSNPTLQPFSYEESSIDKVQNKTNTESEY